MNITEKVRAAAVKCGADLIGFAPVSRFDGEPPELRPQNILPNARTVICYALVQLRGTLKAVEEGTFFQAYNYDSYYFLNQIEGPRIGRQIVRVLEEEGFIAARLHGLISGEDCSAPRKTRAEHAAPPNADVDILHMAVGCGLGEAGHCGLLLTPEYGPRQSIYCIVTDAELEASPVFTGGICDDCGECIKGCPSGAIGEERSESFRMENAGFSSARIDRGACTAANRGTDPAWSPFINGREGIGRQPAYYKKLAEHTFDLRMCAGRGCIRSCADHLERKGRISARFKLPLIDGERWELK